MKYVVLGSENKIICFDHADQVLEYCSEEEAVDLNAYCEDQDYNYETLSSADVGYLYTVVGAENGTNHIFETTDVIKHMRENDIDTSIIEETNSLFNNRSLNEEQNCPGYLRDILADMVPLSPIQLVGGIYRCQNIDGHATEGNE